MRAAHSLLPDTKLNLAHHEPFIRWPWRSRFRPQGGVATHPPRTHDQSETLEPVPKPVENVAADRARDPAEWRLAQAARAFATPEDLLGPLPTALTHRKAPVRGRAAIGARRSGHDVAQNHRGAAAARGLFRRLTASSPFGSPVFHVPQVNREQSGRRTLARCRSSPRGSGDLPRPTSLPRRRGEHPPVQFGGGTLARTTTVYPPNPKCH